MSIKFRAPANVQNPSTGLSPGLVNSPRVSRCKIFATQKVKGQVQLGRSLKGSCPVQWIWKKGQPYLRFCHDAGQDGRLIPVRSSKDALEQARKLCAAWYARTKKIPKSTAKKGGTRYKVVAKELSDGMPQYALGRAKRRR